MCGKASVNSEDNYDLKLDVKSMVMSCLCEGNSQSNAILPDMESEMMSDGSVPAPSQRFSQRIHIDNLEQYVKSGLASGELEHQHAVSTQPILIF